MEPIKIILLLLAGYIVLTIDKKKKLFPGPPVLVLIGIGLSFIGYFASLHIGKEILYEIFLPSLLFISAYRFPPAALKTFDHGSAPWDCHLLFCQSFR